MPRPRRPLASLLPPLAGATLLLLAACASTQAPRFHSLQEAAAVPAAPAAAPALFVDLGPVGVPAGVDQPQWVVRTPDDTLRLLEQERWVAPLRDELRAALADGLARRWNAADLRLAPAPAGAPVWRLRVDVLRFDTVAGTGTRLEAAWSATAASAPAPALACRTRVHEAAAGDAVALAAAHRRAAARLADQIGQPLAELAAGRPANCPAPD